MSLKEFARYKIAVIYGGPSGERPISIKSGKAVRAALKRLGIRHAAIDLKPSIAQELRRAKTDLAFLVTHGAVGEDGRLQGLLDVMGIAYTGSGVLASALAMHKPTAKTIFRAKGLSTADWQVLRPGDPPPKFTGTRVVKPASQGSALGVHVVKTEAAMGAALRQVWKLDNEALVENHVIGVEVTVGVLDEKPLPVVEIIPKHDFYDFHSKYAPGGSRHLVPAAIPASAQKEAQRMALAAHKALGCRHVSRADFIVGRDNRPVLLEVNTLPGMTDVSLLPDAAKAAGLDFDNLVLTLLRLARRDG